MTDPMEYITDTPTIYDEFEKDQRHIDEEELRSRYSEKLRAVGGEIVEVDCE